jgi:hypothetical protein
MWATLGALSILGGFFIYFLKRDLWGLADEVLDGGDVLLIRLARRQYRVELASITRVTASYRLNVATISLELDNPSGLGKKVSFLARSTRQPPTADDLVNDLTSRAMRLRGQRKLV